jgi:hypothetical protein
MVWLTFKIPVRDRRCISRRFDPFDPFPTCSAQSETVHSISLQNSFDPANDNRSLTYSGGRARRRSPPDGDAVAAANLQLYEEPLIRLPIVSSIRQYGECKLTVQSRNEEAQLTI